MHQDACVRKIGMVQWQNCIAVLIAPHAAACFENLPLPTTQEHNKDYVLYRGMYVHLYVGMYQRTISTF